MRIYDPKNVREYLFYGSNGGIETVHNQYFSNDYDGEFEVSPMQETIHQIAGEFCIEDYPEAVATLAAKIKQDILLAIEEIDMTALAKELFDCEDDELTEYDWLWKQQGPQWEKWYRENMSESQESTPVNEAEKERLDRIAILEAELAKLKGESQ